MNTQGEIVHMVKRSKATEQETKHLHTTISIETDRLLEEYANLVDDRGEKVFGSKKNVIEKAISLLDTYYQLGARRKQGSDDTQFDNSHVIWNRARDEMNMVLVGRTTFLSYISGDENRPLKENIAIELIEWFRQRDIHEMNMLETLDAIKQVWIAANYFERVEINGPDPKDKNKIVVNFFHDVQSLAFSEYWGKYFKILLETIKPCTVMAQPRGTLLTLTVYEKSIDFLEKSYPRNV